VQDCFAVEQHLAAIMILQRGLLIASCNVNCFASCNVNCFCILQCELLIASCNAGPSVSLTKWSQFWNRKTCNLGGAWNFIPLHLQARYKAGMSDGFFRTSQPLLPCSHGVPVPTHAFALESPLEGGSLEILTFWLLPGRFRSLQITSELGGDLSDTLVIVLEEESHVRAKMNCSNED
jgi:hypothetical protein